MQQVKPQQLRSKNILYFCEFMHTGRVACNGKTLRLNKVLFMVKKISFDHDFYLQFTLQSFNPFSKQ